MKTPFALMLVIPALIVGCGGSSSGAPTDSPVVPQDDSETEDPDTSPFEPVETEPSPTTTPEPEPISMIAPSAFGSRVVAGDPNCIAATDLVIGMVGAPDSQTIQFPTETPSGLIRALFFYPDDSTTIIFEQRPASNDCNVFAELNSAEPEPEPEPDPEPIIGLEIFNGATVEQFDSVSNVQARITAVAVSEFGSLEAEVLLTNSRGASIRNASCDITALQGNTIIDSAFAYFSSGRPIDPRESALVTATWFDLEDDFSRVDRVRVECDWIDGTNSENITSGSITVGFVSYTSTEFSGKPAVTLLLTNDSGITIYNAACNVEAKSGDTIVDDAGVFFANLNDIRAGEAAEETGGWLELDSFDQFDSEPFNHENINCTWLVRRQ